MPFIPERSAIPGSLAQHAQWVCWRYESREGEDRPTKMPYQAKHPTWRASSTKPATWSDVDTALMSATQHGFDGVGFVFKKDQGIVGVDLDRVLNEDGSLVPWARPWVAELNTYMEVSPSGRGIKAICFGTLPDKGINAGDLEMYDHGRYFTITGNRVDGTPPEPQLLDGTVERLYALAKAKQEQREHEREYSRRERYAEAALLKEAEGVRLAPAGTRNDSLNRAAFSLGQLVASGLLDESTVLDTLAAAAGEAGLHIAEIRATLQSGMRAGVQHPRSLPAAMVNRVSGEITDMTAWWSQGITLAELQHKYFEPLRWIIEQICPEGVTLVAAKPKSKKSWIALGLALAIAMQRLALGRLMVNPGRVLFLDLEGNQRRIKDRCAAILGHDQTTWPNNFHVYTEWAKGDECVDRLEQWLLAYPDTRMIVIDLLAEIRPPMEPRANQYDYDREMLVKLNKLAERYGVAILVVHHTRKAKGDDVFDEVSGTLGINGAVSTLWILSRQPDGHVILSMTGRDLVHDDPLALRWDGYACQFVIEGNASEVSLSAERRDILDLLADDSAWTPKQIAADLGKSVSAIQFLLKDMLAQSLIDKTGYGKYCRIPQKPPQSTQSTQSTQNTQNTQTKSEWTLSPPPSEFGSLSDAGKSPQKSDSEYSEGVSQEDSYWKNIPPGKRTIVHLYLRSDRPADITRAHELCHDYGLNYEDARQVARRIV